MAGLAARTLTQLRSPLAPFAVRSFRFQWPADLLMSWAFEMETLILGWYVLVETGSVLDLTLFGSLQFVGTLLAPAFGVAGDRLGRRTTLCLMRGASASLAAILMTLGLTGLIAPASVFAVAFLRGLVRPSDIVMRNALIGDTMSSRLLLGAVGLSRMTQDTARIAGALAGAGLFAALGIGYAYVVVTLFYFASLCFTFGVSRVHPMGAAEPDADGRTPVPSRLRDLRDGLAHVWNAPRVLALMWLAFLANLTAFPMTHGLMPYVAREIYRVDTTGLGHLLAAFATGALIGSMLMALVGGQMRSPRFMLGNLLLWYAALAIFSRMPTKDAGLPVLVVMGVFHSMAMISMTGVLLAAVSDRFRARVMGIRMLAVYGLPLGLLASGPLIEAVGYHATIALYVGIGVLFTLLIAWRWRAALLR